MPRILITGSSDGLGSLAAKALVQNGHKVVLHGRNAKRAEDAQKACPGAESALVGDLSNLPTIRKLAEDANKSGPFDCVIHNAGLYRCDYMETTEGYPSQTVVNTMAPYLLTCLLKPRPARLIFLSSGLHANGDSSLKDWTWKQRGQQQWSSSQGYADSKLHNVMLAKAFARRWHDSVVTSSLDPGWMPTKMGGYSAPGDLTKATALYVMLAEGREEAGPNGRHFANMQERSPKREANDQRLQDKLMSDLKDITGLDVPI